MSEKTRKKIIARIFDQNDLINLIEIAIYKNGEHKQSILKDLNEKQLSDMIHMLIDLYEVGVNT